MHTAKNATDLMQIVDFTGLMQFANELYQACWLHQVCEHQTCCKLTFADLLQVVANGHAGLMQVDFAASLLTTCNRLVIIRPEQVLRTHPDIGLVIRYLLQLARFWLCGRRTGENTRTSPIACQQNLFALLVTSC